MKISECLLLMRECLIGIPEESSDKIWKNWTTNGRFLKAMSEDSISEQEFTDLFYEGSEPVLNKSYEDKWMIYSSLCMSEKVTDKILDIVCTPKKYKGVTYHCEIAAANNPKTPYSVVRKNILKIDNYAAFDALRNKAFLKQIEKEDNFHEILSKNYGRMNYARNPAITPKNLQELIEREIRLESCGQFHNPSDYLWNSHVTPKIIHKYKKHFLLYYMAFNPNTPNDILEEIERKSKDIYVLRAIARNTNASPQLLFKIYRSNRNDRELCKNLAYNINIPYILIDRLVLDNEYREILNNNPALTHIP